MKYQFIIIALLLLVINACSPKRSTLSANYVPTLKLLKQQANTFVLDTPKSTGITPRLLLSLERYPCFGKCPVYKIDFFENGLVRYSGKQYTNLIGEYSTTISATALYDLLQFASNINHFEFAPVYPTFGKIIMDVPLTVTYVQYGSEINRVENHHNAPIELIKFEEHIDSIIDNLDFKLIN